MMTSDASTAVRAIGAIASVQTIVTSPPMGQYCFARCGLSACVVVCNTAAVTLPADGPATGRSGGWHCTVGQSCYVR